MTETASSSTTQAFVTSLNCYRQCFDNRSLQLSLNRVKHCKTYLKSLKEVLEVEVCAYYLISTIELLLLSTPEFRRLKNYLFQVIKTSDDLNGN